MEQFWLNTTHNKNEAVLAAVAYADVFGNVLSDAEVMKLAVGQLVGQEDLATTTDSRLVPVDGWWCLAGREKLLDGAARNKSEMTRKIELVNNWAWLFKLLPGVLMVGITGSVAGGNPRVEDDIDILIICKSKRLWSSRLVLSSVLSALGKRRKPTHSDDQVKDLLCLNMWVSMKSLEEGCDIYNANELARIIPVVNKQQMYQRYLRANSWMDDYLPGARVREEIKDFKPGKWNVLVPLGDGLELFSRKLLKHVMRRPSTEVVTDKRLQFHPADHRQRILQAYRAKLLELKIGRE